MSIATATLSPLVVQPDQSRVGHPVDLMGHRITPKALGADTGGQFAIGVVTAPPMSGPPLHQHSREDEWFYVLKGEFVFLVGDAYIQAGPGTSLFAPRDIPHVWQNFGPGNAELLCLITPPEVEEFFLTAAEQAGDPVTLNMLLDRYGIQILGSPLLDASVIEKR